jgi:hypothetical protein
MNEMMTKLPILLFAATVLTYAAEPVEDQDMDGVPDNIDKCLNSPFLTEVDSNGCATQKLIFPKERDNGSLDVILGYGYSNNDDNIGRNEQHVTKLQATYFLNDWIYTLQTGYFTSDTNQGMTDTALKIKRRFKPTKNFKFALGAGVRLPSYRFEGNRADIMLYSSLIYYPASAVSLFAGFSHTFINDKEVSAPLQNINALYLGTGYFFTKEFYINASYSYSDTKFVNYHKIKTLSSTLFYQLDEKWFISCTYSRELEDYESHDAFSIRLGYSVW